MFEISRRGLLTASAALALANTPVRALARSAPAPRILVLLELNGGNDGLNTVVPYSDPRYAQLRPQLALPRERVLPLDERLGLHEALEPLMASWRARELAVALGVGYAQPNRSHFRSIEIWDSASAPEETLQDGWLHRVLTETGTAQATPPLFVPQGIVLGGPEGPLAGSSLSAVTLRDPRQLKQAAGLLGSGGSDKAANPALTHILATRARMQDAAAEIGRRLEEAPPLAAEFPKTALGEQLRLAAQLIAAGTPASVFKVQHSGYDTHAQQAGRHAVLLGDLAAALAAFREAMVAVGTWERVTVMTYAEFGRRAAENASGGTDHGTAAPHFLLGGGVRGGLYGRQPALDDLEGGDLKPSLDFRQLYATAASWLGLPPAPQTLGQQVPLALLA